MVFAAAVVISAQRAGKNFIICVVFVEENYIGVVFFVKETVVVVAVREQAVGGKWRRSPP